MVLSAGTRRWGNLEEERLQGIAAGEVQDDAACRADQPPADLEEFESQGGDLGRGQFGSGQGGAAEVIQEHVGRRRQEHTELVGFKIVTTGAVGEEAQLLFLDAVLHLAALDGAVLALFDESQKIKGETR